MALPADTYRHCNRWIGTFPSPWWIYLRLRALGYLAPGASGEAVRRIVREAIDAMERERRQIGVEPVLDLGEPWNIRVPARLWEEKLLSLKGNEMALWSPWSGEKR